ncbi:MAG: DUF1385 domain-containing protein [bacterium]
MHLPIKPKIGGVSSRFGVGILFGSRIAFATRLKSGEIKVFSREVKTSKSNFFKIPLIRSLRVFHQVFLNFSLSRKNLIKLSKEGLIDLHRRKRFLQGVLCLILFICLSVGLEIAIEKLPYILQFIVYLLTLYVSVRLFFLFIMGERCLFYHGAEHKVIKAFLAGDDLTLEAVNRYSPIASRCGTNLVAFLILLDVLMPTRLYEFFFNKVGIAFSKVILLLNIIGIRFGNQGIIVQIFSEMILFIGMLGIAYELLFISFKYEDRKWIKLILLPISFIQKITTREPSSAELEVALAALKEVLPTELK